jgi:hypothetical protein
MNTKTKQCRVFGPVNAKALIKLVGPSVAALGLLCMAKPAGAQAAAVGHARFGDQGQLAITAENLFGFSSQSATVHEPAAPLGNGDVSDTNTRLGLLFGSQQGGVVPNGLRVAGHYFVIPSLSIGGTIGFESRGGSGSQQDVNSGVTISQDKQNETSFVILPKVGYALMFNDIIGFWFRGGLGYASDTRHLNDAFSPDHQSTSFWLVSAEALFVVSPVPNFGFYVGPTAELSFHGSFDNTNTNPQGVSTTTSYSASYQRLAIDTGLIGYFDL